MELAIIDGVMTPELRLNAASLSTQLKLCEIHLAAHNRRNGWRVCLVLASIVAAWFLSPSWIVGLVATGLLVGRSNVLEYMIIWLLLNSVIYGVEKKGTDFATLLLMLADIAALDAKTKPRD